MYANIVAICDAIAKPEKLPEAVGKALASATKRFLHSQHSPSPSATEFFTELPIRQLPIWCNERRPVSPHTMPGKRLFVNLIGYRVLLVSPRRICAHPWCTTLFAVPGIYTECLHSIQCSHGNILSKRFLCMQAGSSIFMASSNLEEDVQDKRHGCVCLVTQGCTT